MYRILGADGREYGPVTAEQLRQWITQGRANAATSTRVEGASEWKPLGQLPEFSLMFPAPAIRPPVYLPVRTTNSFAVIGMVMGILSITGGICCYGLPFNILGLIFSIIGLAQINSEPDAYEGKSMAIVGIVLSILGLLFMFGLLTFVMLTRATTEPLHHFRRL